MNEYIIKPNMNEYETYFNWMPQHHAAVKFLKNWPESGVYSKNGKLYHEGSSICFLNGDIGVKKNGWILHGNSEAISGTSGHMNVVWYKKKEMPVEPLVAYYFSPLGDRIKPSDYNGLRLRITKKSTRVKSLKWC